MDKLPVPVALQMATRRRFGFSERAHLNPALLAALAESGDRCDICREIGRDIERNAEGGDYVESPSFSGRSIQALDAHFKFHWKDGYELIDLVKRPG